VRKRNALPRIQMSCIIPHVPLSPIQYSDPITQLKTFNIFSNASDLYCLHREGEKPRQRKIRFLSPSYHFLTDFLHFSKHPKVSESRVQSKPYFLVFKSSSRSIEQACLLLIFFERREQRETFSDLSLEPRERYAVL